MGRKKRGDALEEKKEGPTSLFILRESNLLRRVTKGGIYIGCLLQFFGLYWAQNYYLLWVA